MVAHALPPVTVKSQLQSLTCMEVKESVSMSSSRYPYNIFLVSPQKYIL